MGLAIMNLRLSDRVLLTLSAAVAALAFTGCAGESEPEATAAVEPAAAPAAMPTAMPAAGSSLEDSVAYPADGIPAFPTEHLASKGFYYAVIHGNRFNSKLANLKGHSRTILLDFILN